MVATSNAPPQLARHVVMIVGSRGTSCTGAAIARDLVLTAAHCVQPGADYKLVSFDAARQPKLLDVATIARHPGFAMAALNGHRATADIALLKPAAPLPATFVPARLAPPTTAAVGDAFTVVGMGLAVQGDGRSGGTARAATLVATGRPGSLQLRLHDPATRGEAAGAGACTGDSGAPVFVETGNGPAVAGVVSWSTGPKLAAGCGGLTGVTPLTSYRAWVVDTAHRMGARLAAP
ncbi:peptidase S1 [Rhodoplanes elegans]|uniref:Peptidase S1 n=2 Tax=Rhodoplanes elegans TaxID=29408 RepID=A0A327K5H3_9BRAD|nr:S1 family peptidase [Rhodoplanes elegans]MBK5960683.1 peptidase S1 [Rhodoplanes elegans]RAI32965.1 peptidase S1 [Rhodoplanes elegans]